MIPKIIHQVWGRKLLPDFCVQLGTTWKEYHPDWKYEFWDDERMEVFVKKHYPHLTDAYFNFKYNIQRWDVIRYMILYKIGGMYVDFDYECLEPADNYVAGEGKCYFAMAPNEDCVNFFGKDTFTNALMASCPEHPFFKKIIEHIFFESQYTYTNDMVCDVHTTTGPVMLTELYRNYPNKDEIVLLPEELVSPWSKFEARDVIFGKANNLYLDKLEKKLEKAFAVHYFFSLWDVEEEVDKKTKQKRVERLYMFFKKSLERLVMLFRTIGNRQNLNKLAITYGTDKVGAHNYTPHYMEHFKKMRFNRIKLLEIGVGGYEKANYGGHSLRMWKRYFPKGQIFSIDIHDKSSLQEKRIKIYQGSQVDEVFLMKALEDMGNPDIIIDDGSHINEHVIETFRLLFPMLKDGGIYVIEDTQTSYWEDFGGNSTDLNNPVTTMNFFKSLTDSLNHQEFIIPGYQQTYYDKKIVSIHFYHNLIFIYKGDNNEKSNRVRNNQI